MPNVDRPRDENYLNRKLEEFDRRLRALETAPRLPLSSIKGGQMLILDDNGNVVAALGKDPNTGQTRITTSFPNGNSALFSGITSSGSVETWLFRASGEMALRIGGNPNQPQFLAIIDRQGNGVVSDDTVSGQGLATPYIPLPLPLNMAYSSWPNTTASSWSRMAASQIYLQHPKIRVVGLAFADTAGTTGQVRVRIGGSVTLGTVNVSNSFVNIDITNTHGLPWQTFAELDLEGQRTAGTGTIWAVLTGVWGIQS